MRTLAGAGGVLLVLATLVDGFNTIVLPRRVRHSIGLTRLFYQWSWMAYAGAGKHIRNGSRREEYLGVYGPLSTLELLVFWAAFAIVGFGLLQYAASGSERSHPVVLADALYLSASSLFMVASA